MNEEHALAEIIQTLTIDHSCHAVILYGSRARGDFQPTSDWDVAGIREAGATAPLRTDIASAGLPGLHSLRELRQDLVQVTHHAEV